MGLKEKLAGYLSLPKEIVLNLPVITMTGGDTVNIENYKGIIEYADNRIRINTGSGIFMIEGKNLMLKQITSEHIAVSGEIGTTAFLR